MSYAEQLFAKNQPCTKISIEDTLEPAPGVYLCLHYENDFRRNFFIPAEAWNRLRMVEPGKP